MAASRRLILVLASIAIGLMVWATQQQAQAPAPASGRRPIQRFANGRPDSALVWGPTQYTSNHATNWTYVAGTLDIPSFDASKRYFVRITNGDTVSGANRVSQASMTIAGKEFLSSSDITSSISAMNKVIWITQAQSTLQFGVRGPVGSFIKARIYETNDPSYNLHSTWGEITVPYGLNLIGDNFSKPSNASGPWTVRVVNGEGDGTGACSNLKVTLNGVDVIPLGLVNPTNLTVVRQVTLQTNNVITLRLYGESGYATLYWTASDTTAPTMNVVRPIDGYVTDTATVATTAMLSDQTPPMSVKVGSLSNFNSTNGFTVAAPLPIEGLYNLTISATDRAGYTKSVTRHVIRDNTAPHLTVSRPTELPLTTDSSMITVGGAWSDTSLTTVWVDDKVVGFDSSGTFSAAVPLDVGPNGILFRARDSLGRVTQLKRFVYRSPANEETPRDSSDINLAQGDPTQSSSFRDLVRFLYLGDESFQSDNDTTLLVSGREAVVRGRVLARDFGPLANVEVRVLDHPEYGVSVTRADGSYSLVVNGGGALILRFTKAEFLESQRRVEVPTQDYALLDDVALIGRSSQSHHVKNDEIRVLTARFESDANGDRRLWMIVPQGIVATVTPTGESPIYFSEFRIRLKEFTVGSSGDESMPGNLPPSTAYTYCVSANLVEADSILAHHQPAGTTQPDITFNQPIVSYTREFLGMRVGSPVPSGVYDARKGTWVARQNGRVVRILAGDATYAALDTDGDSLADPGSYSTLGITDAERAKLKTLFSPGDSLWRVPVDHFSSVDFNFNEGQQSMLASAAGARAGQVSALVDDGCVVPGCVIEVENRVLGETIPLRGVPYALHYRSNRQPGDRAMRWIRVPLMGASKPSELIKVIVQVDIAGRRFRQEYAAAEVIPNDVRVFKDWNGTDVFGRRVNGSVTATVRIGYEFPGVYATSSSGDRAFGNGATVAATGGKLRSGDRTANRVVWNTQRVSVGAPNMESAGLGGWTITPHHFYDRNGRGTIYFGDGAIRLTNRNYPIIQNYAGNGGNSPQVFPEGQPALSSGLGPADIAFAPDGSLLFTDATWGRVVQITRDGSYHLIAGGGPIGVPTDGLPAVGQGFGGLRGLAVAPDGTVYFVASSQFAVFKVTPAGLLYRVAGTLSQTSGSDAEDTLAIHRKLVEPTSVALGPDGSLFIGNHDPDKVLRVGTDGRIRTYAGNGAPTGGEVSTEGKATEIPMHQATDLETDGEGNLYIAEYGNDRIRRVSPDGRMITVKHLDGRPSHLDLAPDGSLYVMTGITRQVARIEPDGSVTTLAGGYGPNAPVTTENLGYARAAAFTSPAGVALGPDGGVYIAEIGPTGSSNNWIRRILSELPGEVDGEIAFPSGDGRQVFHFAKSGRHFRTMDAVTGDSLYSFGYDDFGRLVTIRDAVNDEVTSIVRNGSGAAIKIVGPYLAENLLNIAGEYLASVQNPATSPPETYMMTYWEADAGLLKTFQNPREKTQKFRYKLGSSDEDDGRLDEDEDASNAIQKFTLQDLGTIRHVTHRSAENRVTMHEITEMLDGLRRRIIWSPDASRSAMTDSMNVTVEAPPIGERIVEVGPAGEATVTFPARDSRFGMLAQVPARVETRLPSGLVRTITNARFPETSTLWTETMQINTDPPYTIRFNSQSQTRSITTTTPAGRTSTVALDPAGRPTSIQVGGLLPVSLTYDSRGKLTRLEQGARGWRYGYDNVGRLTELRDTLTRMTTYEYDGADRVLTQRLPAGHAVGYAYDAMGNLTGLTPPGSQPHAFLYTPVDLNERYTPPSVPGISDPATRYEFNLDRQLEKVIRPDNGIVDLVYEGGTGRLASIVHPRGTNAFTYWDTPQLTATHKSGQVKTIGSPDGVTLSYAYDGPLLKSETWSGSVSGSVERSYDAALRVSEERVIVGATASTAAFAYDLDGLLTQAGPMAIHRRAADGLPDSTVVGLVTSSIAYNGHGEPTELHYTVNGTPLFHEHIRRDALGRIERIDETWSGVTTVRKFRYDLAGRLDTVRDGNDVQIRRYEYDNAALGNGNRTKEFGPGDQLLATASYDAQDRLTNYGGASYSYTAAGELTQRTSATETLATTYDAFGNLVAATVTVAPESPVAITYRVDGRNRRVQRMIGGSPVSGWLYRDGVSVLAELDGTGALLHRYVHGLYEHVPDLLLHGDTATYRLVTDHLGSVRAVVRTTDGIVVERRDFDAWGVATLATAPAFQSLGYGGGLSDPVTNLSRFGIRDYDPTTGRWNAKDPSTVRALETNVYLFVEHQPMDWIDPNGEFKLPPDPKGLPPGWYRDPQHRSPNGEMYRNPHRPNEWLRYDRPQPEMPGNRARPHWHHSSNRKKHLFPGTEIPDPPKCPVPWWAKVPWEVPVPIVILPPHYGAPGDLISNDKKRPPTRL